MWSVVERLQGDSSCSHLRPLDLANRSAYFGDEKKKSNGGVFLFGFSKALFDLRNSF